MKKWVLSLSLAAGVIGLAGCSGGNGEAVVKTSAGDISKEEFYDALKDKYGEQVLQQLVIEKVLSKEYKVSDKELDEQVEEVKAQVGPQFPMVLAQYGYKDEEEFRESLKLSVLQEKAATKDIKVTEKELKEYYENKQPDIEVSHIVVGPEDEKKIKEAKEKLDKGEDFAKVAKEYSIDATAENGGSLGLISRDQPDLDEDFKEAAFKLKKDEISAPIQTQFGWHIILVTDKKEKEPFDKVKADLEKELKKSKLDADVVQNALKAELEKAKLDVKDKDLKAAFDPILKDSEEPADDTKDDAEKEDKK
ncbi:peptidylprolyl isomerase [Lederbergia lenta]|uniref:Foldase protein PrsA n=1 Tax=Lederbergia lenta TaxID=1467 RepID=A0A2X4WQW0_LEDLE|nr:peptidylprolyl isomerase [Lederbergia lenta]MCM3110522.1 peptidylprolyl isomerase [Lederbergia lenta]MEC2323912.1 peptidylprolyl isomerase [Lederbergia lenta]SQI61032.1 PpiC-type peptidyl-prolyl cis-trans isomerase [Lederbergia lenta]